ncbi:phosphoenolpyruvate carboxykinase [Candidatus Xianfuyuplasma coldseepsis]|uniref:Phosphoenolpyruvate carboxykinase n=1 Tax=Candidatus Xianfuyuplasma coldseepsis TaxID=2782163 RepID=A0A7L7KQE3_9MOLU|nr:phosphoenolpyruvate carboxykinase [Xianfuyuplasma coldseepsis]QMS84502.1 phosphoenolpyruvate carboxykinase [Xianfuyuplasma coldseepsis]
MIKEFSINSNNVIVNFSIKYCQTEKELLDSKSFEKILHNQIKYLQKQNASLLDRLHLIMPSTDLENEFLRLFKLLIIMDKQSIAEVNPEYLKVFQHTSDVIDFIEGLYNYWRGLERYALIQTTGDKSGIQNVNFIEAKNAFTNLVLKTYRRIEENLMEKDQNIYRQLSAGINAGIVLTDNKIDLPSTYDKVEDIPIIQKIVFTPPFIIYPNENKRSGLFERSDVNPIDYIELNQSHFFCYPAKVGSSLAFVYFHRDFMNHGVSLCNLFDLAEPEEYINKSPDLIYVFGARLPKHEKRTVYYYDKKNDIHVGYVSNTKEVDYFGYMKKMILTLHNLRMIKLGNLPIHGAMVHITLKNGIEKTIAIVGDSGAGKSESLEAFRTLSKKYLKEIKIIFDDMGSFHIEDGKVIGYGTEIGAFVRLDDLEMGYSFKEMDRAIFMNPHRQNARVLLPVSTYDVVTRGYEVDILLYANNYEDTNDVLRFFDTPEKAIDVFSKGRRKAKGTTSESGLVESFFANPFGPVQEEQATTKLINQYFNQLFDNNIPVGEIYTKLAIPTFERKGPEQAAKQLFKWLQQ